jgi:CRISPR system Cascade subunit CasE
MFLTRFHLDPRSRAGARYLEDPQRLHAAIYRAFPTQPVEVNDGRRPLWRLDRDDPWNPLLWVVSEERPGFDALADEAGRSVDGRVYESRDYMPLLNRLGEGQVYAFRLAGNAVRSGRSSPDAKGTKRFGHVTPVQQTRWLDQQADAHGFRVRSSTTGELDAAVVGRRRTVFWRDGQRVVIAVCEFIGHLDVTDPERLRRALTGGIGHARAYGCGLLTLAASRR